MNVDGPVSAARGSCCIMLRRPLFILLWNGAASGENALSGALIALSDCVKLSYNKKLAYRLIASKFKFIYQLSTSKYNIVIKINEVYNKQLKIRFTYFICHTLILARRCE